MFSRMRQKKTSLSTRESGNVFLELRELSRVYHSLRLEAGGERDREKTTSREADCRAVGSDLAQVSFLCVVTY